MKKKVLEFAATNGAPYTPIANTCYCTSRRRCQVLLFFQKLFFVCQIIFRLPNQSNTVCLTRENGGVALSKFSIRLCPSRHLQTVVTPCGFFQELS